MGAIFNFTAKNFDVKAVVSKLDFGTALESVHVEGQPLYLGSEANYMNSGFTCFISESSPCSLEDQIEAVIRFIKKHYVELSLLRDLSQQLDEPEFIIRLNIELSLFDNPIVISPELARLTSAIGADICIAQFLPPGEFEEDDDEDEV